MEATIHEKETEPPDLDELFHALVRQPRRHVLMMAAEHPLCKPSDLALEALGIATDEVEAREPLLSHQHLPRLEDVGLVEWDEETGVVTRGPRFEDSRPLIECVDGFEDELTDDRP